MSGFSSLELLIVVWGVVSVFLIGLVIHPSILGFREVDRIFVEGEGKVLQKEQVQTLRSISHIDPWIKGFIWLSGGLLLLIFAIWIYPGISALMAG
jgi:hypothetical protein